MVTVTFLRIGNEEKGEKEDMSALHRNSHFIANHFVDNFFRRLSGGEGFGRDVFSGEIVNQHHFETLAGSNTAHIGIYSRRCSGQFLVQRVRFFFGHDRHISLLKLVSQHTILFAASHRVKNISRGFSEHNTHYTEQEGGYSIGLFRAKTPAKKVTVTFLRIGNEE
jgi:hypothetical protein